MTGDAPLVSVVIPCLDEAECIEACVTAARAALSDGGYDGEVVVVDNGSSDGSGALAQRAGARVVVEPRRGYGSAYLAGFAAARGTYVVMADADLTYDFAEIGRFVACLQDGAELVIGDRMRNIEPGAMPWMHRYVGNPLLSSTLNLFFKTGVHDAHCGMRALRRDVLPRLDLRTTGMEFASEMVIRAGKARLRIAELPIRYRPRGGTSKLRRWSDGWRHLRFLLIHSPTHLFLWPGTVLAVVGALIAGISLSGVELFGREWQIHTMVGGSLLMIVAAQVLSLGVLARAYGVYYLGEPDPWLDGLRSRFRLEHGLALGGLVMLVGVVGAGVIFVRWIDNGFGSLSEERLAVLAATLVVIGAQIVFAAFMLSILGLRRTLR